MKTTNLPALAAFASLIDSVTTSELDDASSEGLGLLPFFPCDCQAETSRTSQQTHMHRKRPREIAARTFPDCFASACAPLDWKGARPLMLPPKEDPRMDGAYPETEAVPSMALRFAKGIYQYAELSAEQKLHQQIGQPSSVPMLSQSPG